MEYIIHLLIIFSIYAMLALSLNLLFGYTGLMSLAHAAFFGIGAYAVGILTTKTEANFFVASVIGIISSMITAALWGLVLSKFKGDYYTFGSLGVTIIVFATMLNWQNLTSGPFGIPGIHRPSFLGIDFSLNVNFLLLTLVCLVSTYIVSDFIVKSSFGRALKAIREDEQALQVFGYNVHHFKLLIFIIAAGLAAIAGALFAAYITYIDPTSFSASEAVFLWSIIILGGLANLRGSLLGALFLILLPEALRFVGFPNDIAAQMRQVVYGLLLVFLMLYRPQGLMGEYKL